MKPALHILKFPARGIVDTAARTVRSLGRTVIAVRHIEDMSDEELRAIELDENAQRRPLDDFETSKARLAQIRQAEADLKAKTVRDSSKSDKTSKGGRPSKGAVSRKKIAAEILVRAVTGIRVRRSCESGSGIARSHASPRPASSPRGTATDEVDYARHLEHLRGLSLAAPDFVRAIMDHTARQVARVTAQHARPTKGSA